MKIAPLSHSTHRYLFAAAKVVVWCMLFPLVMVPVIASPASSSSRDQGDTHQSRLTTADLIHGLQSPDAVRRQRAVEAASRTKPLPLKVVPPLLNCFRDGLFDPRIFVMYRRLVRALSNAGVPALPQLSLALNDPDKRVRLGAVDALVAIARDPPAHWPVLISSFASTHDDVSLKIAEELFAIGPPIVPLLRRSLYDPNPRIRSGSAVALSYLLEWHGRIPSGAGTQDATPWKYWTGAPPGEALSDLVAAWNSLDSDVHVRIIGALTATGPFAQGAIPGALSILEENDPNNRITALNFLTAMGPAAKIAIPNLVHILNETSPLRGPEFPVRLKVMDVLAPFGSAAKSAVPPLVRALKDTDTDISEHAAMALANIDPGNQQVLPILLSMIDRCCESGSAITAMGNMGHHAQAAIPVLEHLLTADDQPGDRRAAVTALARIAGPKAVPDLERALRQDNDDSVRTAAAAALGQLGPTSPAAISALVDALSNDSEAVRQSSSAALSSVGSPAVPALISALKSPYLYQRVWAIQTLSQIKPLPDNAASALTVALADESRIVKAAAADALKGSKVDAVEAIRNEQMNEESEASDDEDAEFDAFKNGTAIRDTRHYSKAELIGSIPPDANHEFPAQLRYFVSVAPSRSSNPDAEFLVTVHQAKEGMDRLAVWKKTGDDQYVRLFAEVADPDSSFDQPVVFSSRVLVKSNRGDHYETALLVDLPLHRFWGDGEGVDDTVFAVDNGELRYVEIQPPDEWYAKKLRPGEWTWNSLGNTFADNDLQFMFGIWEKDQCHACPGGAEVKGTYKIIKELHFDSDQHRWVTKWKMVVDTAKREPRT